MRYRCRTCKRPVELLYDHQGPLCTPIGADCAGTFEHTNVLVSCERRLASLTHAEVEPVE